MATVFIGGSRAVSRLNTALRAKLDEFTARNCQILVGDATGADKAAQQHFALRGYNNVTVFCMDTCRNNLGGWTVRKIASNTTKRDFAYYVAKDIAMAQEATCGMMLWDGKSKGTLNNIRNLVDAGKPVLVYFAPTKDLHRISGNEELQALLARCDVAHIQHAESRIAGLPPVAQQRLPISYPSR